MGAVRAGGETQEAVRKQAGACWHKTGKEALIPRKLTDREGARELQWWQWQASSVPVRESPRR